VTPTLLGRLQTRIFVIVVIGGLWTAMVTPILPGVPSEASLADTYGITFRVLVVVLVLGLVWELAYHALQQFRWEKDWPALFGLFTGINEGIVAWFVANLVIDSLPGSAFLLHFATTWLLTWFWVNGPMRVLSLRWRYRGGRLL
jgi:hypothetical protein